MAIVAINGGFGPIHVGHIRHIRAARELGEKLIVILTRDDQLARKKGYVFMPYEERKEILENIVGVQDVVENIDTDITSSKSLAYYRPDILAKGSDRTAANMPATEIETCKRIGCKIVYGVGGGKIRSSSELVQRYNRHRENPASPNDKREESK